MRTAKPQREFELSHEDLFVRRYDDLFSWALQLTGRDRDRAEELVQEAFVHFVLAQPDLAAIENLDGYLYCTLRNLHVSSLRRLNRSVEGGLAIVDYDTAELGLTAGSWLQVEAQDELRQVCRYACERKRTSKAASILILRFFHGYYPSEMAAITRTPRETLAVMLNTARSEVRTFLAEPSRVRFMKATMESLSRAFFRRTNADFVQELRQAIFRAKEGDCPSTEMLRAEFGGGRPDSVDVGLLAHLVSCRPCLDSVNGFLNLPLLADRHPSDMLGPDPRNRGGGGPSGSSSGGGSAIGRAKRRLRDVFEHQPRELRLVVNGVVRGWQTLSGSRTELTMVLEPTESVDFVELVSDQGRRLLFLNVVAPPAGAFEQQGHVRLSDDRRLDVVVRFGGDWPHIQVIYTDPATDAVVAPAAINALSSSPASPPMEAGRLTTPARIARFPRLLREEPDEPRARPWFGWLRPASALVTALTLTVLAWTMYQTMTPASAAELLASTHRVEAQALAPPNAAVHRIINVERRILPNGAATRQRVDVWRNTQRGVVARRLYDADARLIAGEWEYADGSRTRYRPGVKPEPSASAGSGPIRVDDVWRWEPSAETFSRLIDDVGQAHVTSTPDAYVLTYKPARPTVSGIVEVAIRISRKSERAVEQTITVQNGNGLIQVRSTESALEQVAPDRAPARAFEPDTAFIEIASTPPSSSLTAPPVPVAEPAAKMDPVALERLELLAWYRLHGAGVWPGELAQVTRTDAAVIVRATVPTEARAEVLRARLAGERELQLDISVAPQATAAAPVDVSTSFTGRRLEEYFAAQLRGPGARPVSEQEVTDVAAKVANWVIERSKVRLEHAKALADAADRWTPDMFARLGPDAGAMWYTMLRDHANTLQQTTESLRLQLQPIFFPDLPLDEVADADTKTPPPSSPRELAQQVLNAVARQNETLTRLFARATTGRPNEADVQVRQLGRSLRDLERLVHRFTLPFSL
jgi:RNA polymerase sigma factor (sigma-70 family)